MSLPTPASPPTFDAQTLRGVVRLDGGGLLRAHGADAAKFLHGQLTQDFALMGLSEARLAAFCNAKGRMQASFVAFKRAHDDIVLVCAPDLRAQTLKRLGMFVLRAQVKLAPAGDELALYGVAGADVPPALPAAAWSHQTIDGLDWVRLPDAAGLARALACGPVNGPTPAGPALALAHWQWLEVRSAVVAVTAPVFEAFVPQMLNYESVGGVNFKKGCYPGQEVVARSQYRGTLKRRAYPVHADAPMAVGQEVFHPSDAEQPCGTVAASAPHPVAGWDAVVSMQTSAADGQPLTLGSPSGPPLALQPLPYPLLADV
ncbi:folate-binding protein YgfZ [Aquabacterium sp. A08]|uniref:CAF17-like 4Fe-4S cluster assembly/insertion protein YgfZ n=1 Tax=Aquabacterium sp. A08 TaxID=2718532 RepID=UPI001420EF4D|nr:folate-binding protein YgfZ [Aquabacterium sp. A08]NIC40757.1 folate-binding protein YgfZ [Aquabacterium sp. A08]NIC42197.1 folate-binding protein YgfZ [Aquabacterium sp. A08]NIC43602.1 folate-binding protein YgfZ [Aquabacterium sp. A08]